MVDTLLVISWHDREWWVQREGTTEEGPVRAARLVTAMRVVDDRDSDVVLRLPRKLRAAIAAAVEHRSNLGRAMRELDGVGVDIEDLAWIVGRSTNGAVRFTAEGRRIQVR